MIFPKEIPLFLKNQAMAFGFVLKKTTFSARSHSWSSASWASSQEIPIFIISQEVPAVWLVYRAKGHQEGYKGLILSRINASKITTEGHQNDIWKKEKYFLSTSNVKDFLLMSFLIVVSTCTRNLINTAYVFCPDSKFPSGKYYASPTF